MPGCVYVAKGARGFVGGRVIARALSGCARLHLKQSDGCNNKKKGDSNDISLTTCKLSPTSVSLLSVLFSSAELIVLAKKKASYAYTWMRRPQIEVH